jgi:N-acetylglucosaminyldiphosphoundecaprenol N-acetyl-beta-D-mannosaminyltransferase
MNRFRGNAVSVLGLLFHNVDMTDTIDWIDRCIASGGFHQIATANVDFVLHALNDRQLQDTLCTCDLVLPDGMPIVWASRWLGSPLRARVTGVDLVQQIARRSSEVGHRIFLLGADDSTCARAIAWMENKYPGVKIAGRYSPPIAALEDMDHESILRRVNDSRADILLVAFGNPKQERWLAMHRDRLNVSVAIGVGGTFDILAGKISRAPRWMQRSGLEWLYRMLAEPKRLAPRYYRNLLALGAYLPPQIIAHAFQSPTTFVQSNSRPVERHRTTVVSLAGSLSRASARQLVDFVGFVPAGESVLVDLSATVHIGADGIGALLEARRAARLRDASFELHGVSERIAHVLHRSQVFRLFEHADQMRFVELARKSHAANFRPEWSHPLPESAA